MNQLPPTLSVAEAAKVLDLNPRTVYNMVDRNELHAIHAGRLIRIPTLEFITANRLDRDLVAGRLAELHSSHVPAA